MNRRNTPEFFCSIVVPEIAYEVFLRPQVVACCLESLSMINILNLAGHEMRDALMGGVATADFHRIKKSATHCA